MEYKSTSSLHSEHCVLDQESDGYMAGDSSGSTTTKRYNRRCDNTRKNDSWVVQHTCEFKKLLSFTFSFPSLFQREKSHPCADAALLPVLPPRGRLSRGSKLRTGRSVGGGGRGGGNVYASCSVAGDTDADDGAEGRRVIEGGAWDDDGWDGGARDDDDDDARAGDAGAADDCRRMTMSPSECAEKIASTTSSADCARRSSGAGRARWSCGVGGRSRVSSRRKSPRRADAAAAAASVVAVCARCDLERRRETGAMSFEPSLGAA